MINQQITHICFLYIRSKMEVNRYSSMQTTNQFIKSKCSKDHFSNSKNSPIKNSSSSMYACDYQRKKQLKSMQSNIKIAQQRNSPIKVQQPNVNALSTVYRNSFQKNQQYVAPVKFHQKPSFFLKNQNFETPQSTYNRNSIHKQNISFSQLERGKPKMDNIPVPKYNKMTTKSLYMDTFLDYTKLPLIKQPKMIKHSNLLQSRLQAQPKNPNKK